MIGNVIDHRSSPACPEVDVVFEPSAHDNAVRPDGSEYFPYEDVAGHPQGFHAEALHDTTLREAILHAEQAWPFPVTLHLYDRGTRPLG